MGEVTVIAELLEHRLIQSQRSDHAVWRQVEYRADCLFQHISSAREAVARMLKSFSEDGLVELKRGAITLRDKNRLNRLK